MKTIDERLEEFMDELTSSNDCSILGLIEHHLTEHGDAVRAEERERILEDARVVWWGEYPSAYEEWEKRIKRGEYCPWDSEAKGGDEHGRK